MKNICKKIGSILLALCMVLTVVVVPVFAENEPVVGYSESLVVPADLTGVPDIKDYADNLSATSFKITDAEGWQKFAQLVNDAIDYFKDKTVYLANDLDLMGKSDIVVGRNTALHFDGTFDGQGFTIKNVVVSAPTGGSQLAGLFGYVRGGTVKNLIIGEGSVISSAGDQNMIGGLCGQVYGATIINVKNTALVTSTGTNPRSGGIVGMTNGKVTIQNCTNAGAVSGQTRSGGIVGLNVSEDEVLIDSCVNEASVTTKVGIWFTEACGGILGNSWGAKLTIQNCVNYGAINCSASFGGGIMGCQVVKGGPKIINCKNYGSLEKGPQSAGILGSAMDVSGSGPAEWQLKEDWVTITGCEDLYVPDYGTGYTTMRIEEKLPSELAQIPDLKDYASNSSATEFKITDVEGFKKLSTLVGNGIKLAGVTIYQTDNINLYEVDVDPIGKNENLCFSGIYDGQGYSIDHWVQNADETTATTVVLGMFGYLKDATVKNVVLGKNCSFTYTKNDKTANAGGLAAEAVNTTIDNVNVLAEVTCNGTAASNVGGIVGVVGNATQIKNVTVEGKGLQGTVVGGVAGVAASGATNILIDNSVNRARVSSSATTFGGILGASSATGVVVSNCDNYGASKADTVSAGIVGTGATGVTSTDNEDLFVPIEKPVLEGIIGFSSSRVEKKDLTNVPDISEYWKDASKPEFKISDADGLCELAEIVACMETFEDRTIYLANDINMQGAAGFEPIGSVTLAAFAGTFDGQGHIIDNLELIVSSEATGVTNCALFGSLSGTVKNLIIGQNCYFSAEASSGDVRTAAVVANANSGAVVDNVYSLATVISVASLRYTAGIVAYTNGVNVVVKNCTNTGNITGNGSVAGILAYSVQVGTTVDNCRNTGKVLGTSQGRGDVNASGGIVAYCTGTQSSITNCINNGIVNGYGKVGTLLGFAAQAVTFTVNNCINYGSVVTMGETAVSDGLIGEYDSEMGMTMNKIADLDGEDDSTLSQLETVTPDFPDDTDDTEVTTDNTDEETTDDETESEEVTTKKDSETEDDKDDDGEKKKSGCSSTVFGGVSFLLIAFGAAALVIKKKED